MYEGDLRRIFRRIYKRGISGRIAENLSEISERISENFHKGEFFIDKITRTIPGPTLSILRQEAESPKKKLKRH